MKKRAIVFGAVSTVTIGVLGVLGSVANAQTDPVGGIFPLHICKQCHRYAPEVCDFVICLGTNSEGEEYCGCGGDFGDNDDGTRWARADCLYGSECTE